MAKKETKATKTLTLRLDADKVDKINELADSRGMSIREYVLTQLNPKSELGMILISDTEKVIAGNEYLLKSAVEFISGLANLQSQNNMSEQDLASIIEQQMKGLANRSSE